MNGIQEAVNEFPEIKKLLGKEAFVLLGRVWELHVIQGERSPIINLLLSDAYEADKDLFERGLSALRLNEDMLHSFRKRLLVESPKSFYRDVAAALTELYVGGRFALKGASIKFVERSNTPTHDMIAKRNQIELNVELACINISDDERKHRDKINADAEKLNHGPQDAAIFSRIIAISHRSFGSGNLAQQIKRLAGKKNGKQLAGCKNRLQVMSLWPRLEIGIPDGAFSESYTIPNYGEVSGLFYAATYGRFGDTVKDGPHNFLQSVNGFLVKNPQVGGLIWLLKGSDPIFFENEGILDNESKVLISDFCKQA